MVGSTQELAKRGMGGRIDGASASDILLKGTHIRWCRSNTYSSYAMKMTAAPSLVPPAIQGLPISNGGRLLEERMSKGPFGDYTFQIISLSSSPFCPLGCMTED